MGNKMVDYSSYKDLIIQVNDGVALITINRPEKFNATDANLHNELSRIWLDIGNDKNVRVAVVTGAGPAFSAGGDFDLIEQSMGHQTFIFTRNLHCWELSFNWIPARSYFLHIYVQKPDLRDIKLESRSKNDRNKFF